jgi:hypothetical protein
MDRRRFLLTSLAGVFSAPLVVEAQRAAGPRSIGYLSSNSASRTQHLVAAFRQGLRELGYVEGQNINIEYRFAEGKFERLPAFAAELVELNWTSSSRRRRTLLLRPKVLPRQSQS